MSKALVAANLAKHYESSCGRVRRLNCSDTGTIKSYHLYRSTSQGLRVGRQDYNSEIGLATHYSTKEF